MTERIIEERNIVIRHSLVELIEHWTFAISGLLLIFSGFGELPMYKRFMVTKIPGLGWAGDYFIHLKVHYLAGFLFISIMIFHVIYHLWLRHRGLLPKKGDLRASGITILSFFGLGKEPEFHKYLPEQRIAYAYLGVVGLILVVTGIIKMMKNFPGIFLPPRFITSMTLIHTFGTFFFLFGVLAHLIALIFKANRPLAKSIFSGKVDLNYAMQRHPIWCKELVNKQNRQNPREAKDRDRESSAVVTKEQSSKIVETSGEVKMTTLKVLGMSCEHCIRSVKEKLESLEGIQSVQADLAKGEVCFENSKGLPLEDIKKAIEELGYTVS